MFEEVFLKFTVQSEGQKMNKTHFLNVRTDAQEGGGWGGSQKWKIREVSPTLSSLSM